MATLSRTSISNWLEHYQKSEAARFGLPPQRDSNLFYSLQWMGKDLSKKNLQAWALLMEDKEVAWLATQMNSSECLRFRGIVVSSAYRGQGLGKKIIQETIKEFSSIKRFILFCSTKDQSFYQKVGFHFVPEFIPRPVETYHSESNTYKILCEEKLCLMERML